MAESYKVRGSSQIQTWSLPLSFEKMEENLERFSCLKLTLNPCPWSSPLLRWLGDRCGLLPRLEVRLVRPLLDPDPAFSKKRSTGGTYKYHDMLEAKLNFQRTLRSTVTQHCCVEWSSDMDLSASVCIKSLDIKTTNRLLIGESLD